MQENYFVINNIWKNDITHDFFPRIQNWSFSAAILNFGGHIEIQLLINLFI